MQMDDPIIIGLCGRSGTGKGYVCKKFLAHGLPSVDTDAVYRDMTGPSDHFSPCMQALVSAFGERIARDDRSLDRRMLADLVFGEGGETARLTLNAITHEHILKETKKLAAEYAAAGARAVLVDAPLLFESGFDKQCCCTICVTAPNDVSVQRIVERDGITAADAQRRLDSQITEEELRSRCDYCIENDLHCNNLEEQIAKITEDIFARFSPSEVSDGE